MIENNIEVDLSIVIPVYNVAGYLPKCLDSVLDQINQHNVEIILIDDGSTDTSGEICDKYSERYPSTVYTYHKENGGLSDARNFGILKAKGNFVSFLDSDDYYSPCALEQFYEHLDPVVDLMVGSAFVFYDGEEKTFEHEKMINWVSNNCCKGNEALDTILSENPTYGWFAWKYFVKREMLLKNELFFKKEILFEDVEWSPQLFIYANNVKYLNTPFYCYRLNRAGSIMNRNSKTDTERKFNSQLITLTSHVVRICEGLFPESLAKKLYENLSGVYTTLLYGQMASQDKEKRRKVKELQFFIPYIIRPNEIKIKKIYGIAGYNAVFIYYWIKYYKQQVRQLIKKLLRF